MDRHNGSKINQLLIAWPKGTVALYSFLNRAGVTRQLASVYQRGHWIKRIGPGAFMRADDKDVSWAGGLYALQQYDNLSIHTGGITALEHLGFAHTIHTGGNNHVILYGNPNEKLPSWFSKYAWPGNVQVYYYPTNLFHAGIKDGIKEKELNGCNVLISSAERAIMETLYSLPKHSTFAEIKLLMEGLNALRPEIVQKLLEKCNSIKVKRLFMVLAELFNHEWVKHLNLRKVNFGRGKRMTVRNGVLNNKYNITVPGEYSIEK
ncbi:MAG: hypothetical protein A2252_05905 [Elusimicrobia bacterium RIFOXYA2_FULL_39_19]|nr:MAG: hypothetical protein A2252_05905 [Elusimicrobia bacterium RIFOXYA2_FULL_39_19]